MKIFFSVFLIVSSVLIVSCSEKQKEAKDELYDKVMAVHDEIMPKMGDIMKFKKQLQEKIDALSEAEEIDSVKISELEQAIADLDKVTNAALKQADSHDEMMGWMRQFDNDFEGMVNEDIMKYLNDQMGKIKKVGEVTNAALQNAQLKLAE
jgi:hypothetical protein